jgi:hypothetical protein
VRQLQTVLNNLQLRFSKQALVVIAVGFIGAAGVMLSHAATPVTSIEPENGSLSGMTTVTDSSASGGKSVKFGSSSGGTITCNLNATTSNFAAQVSAATAGQTICLATGNYGTWAGTNKAITITAAPGATPTMQFNFGAGDNGFTLDHMSGMGGYIKDATNITISNSTFSSSVDFDGGTTTKNVLLSHNSFLWNAVSGGINAKIAINESATPTVGTVASPAVIVEFNDIRNGELDGVHIGGGSGVIVRNNWFSNLCDVGVNHTDNIQFEGGSGVLISGNVIMAVKTCSTQGITSFDSGTNGVIIENNVVDIPRDWEIELYSDKNSIVRHNTLVWHAAPYSDFGHATGIIDFENKSSDPAGSGTQVYDNNAFISFVAPTTGTQHHNTNPSQVSFVGGTAPTTHDGFLLAAGSVGKGAASDGTDTGVYAIGTVTYGPVAQ